MSSLQREPEHDACGVGFLADLSHKASHDVIRMSLEAAAAMAHRGARAADGRTGDGAGLLIETPRALYLRELTADHVRIPERHLGAVCLFLPRDFDDAANARAKVEAAVRAGRRRAVALARAAGQCGRARRICPPHRTALRTAAGRHGPGQRARAHARRAPARVAHACATLRGAVLVSASATKVVYKALLSSAELGDYFADLRDPSVRFALRASSTSASARTPRRSGGWCSRSTTSRTTARSTPSPATAPGCRRAACRCAPWASDSLNFNTAHRRDARRRLPHRRSRRHDALAVGRAVRRPPARVLRRAHSDRRTVGRSGGDRLRRRRHGRRRARPQRVPAAALVPHGVGQGAGRLRNRRRRFRRRSDRAARPARPRRPNGRAVRIATKSSRPSSSAPSGASAPTSAPIVKSWAFPLPEPVLTGRAGDPSVERDLRALRLHQGRAQGRRRGHRFGRAASRCSSMGDDAALPFLERRMPVADVSAPEVRASHEPADRSAARRLRLRHARLGRLGRDERRRAGDRLDRHARDRGARRDGVRRPALRRASRAAPHRARTAATAKLDARLAAIVRRSGERRPRRRDATSCSTIAASTLPVPAILAAGAIHQRLIAIGLRMQASIAVADGFARDAHSIATRRSRAGANVVTPWLALRVRGAQRHAQRVPLHGPLGPDQDHGEARHLHAALVHRRADVRVARARARRRRDLFPGHARARAGRRVRAARRRSARLGRRGRERRGAARSRSVPLPARRRPARLRSGVCSRRCAPRR